MIALLLFSLIQAPTAASLNMNLYRSFPLLQRLDALSAAKIGTIDDATAYVRKSMAACVMVARAPMFAEFESRVAKAELDAAINPNKFVSDQQVADAFNVMSDEFGVPNPARLKSSDILQYRIVMASIWHHLFSPSTVNGSRPVAAIMILYQLWYSGGVANGVKVLAKVSPPPSRLTVAGAQIVGHRLVDKNENMVGRRYQEAGRAYFAERSPREIGFFLHYLAAVIHLPESGDHED